MGIVPNAEGSAFIWFGEIYSLGLALHFGFSWSLWVQFCVYSAYLGTMLEMYTRYLLKCNN